MCILFSKWIYITDNNRITHNNMKYWSKFRPNGRIIQRIYILSILVVCIQYKHSTVADRIYTKKWREGKNLSHYAGTLFSARRSWYWFPMHSSVQLRVSSVTFLLYSPPQHLWPAVRNKRTENNPFVWRPDFLPAYRCWRSTSSIWCCTM